MSTKFRWLMFAILVMLTTGLLLTSQASQAQQTPAPAQGHHSMGEHHEMSPEAHLQMLSEKLNLTDDQKAKIKPILENQSQQMKAIHEDSSLSEDQKKAKMKALHESMHSQMKDILTPEQQAKLKEMSHEGMGKHMGMKEGDTDHK